MSINSTANRFGAAKAPKGKKAARKGRLDFGFEQSLGMLATPLFTAPLFLLCASPFTMAYGYVSFHARNRLRPN
jgi:hypothetical protein